MSIRRIVCGSAWIPQQDVFEHDSIAAHREHAIPCGAKCYHINFSRDAGHNLEHEAQLSEQFISYLNHKQQKSPFCDGGDPL